jgi:hypothetical protein
MTNTRHDEIKTQWWSFHKKHPEIYQLFARYTFELIRAGRSHGAAKLVTERIRWESYVNQSHGNDFKINNNYTALYARLFMHHYPEYEGFFKTRVMTSQAAPATKLPPLQPSDYG